MPLLRPLLLDNVPAIQQAAALALGRLANYSLELAEAVVESEILPQLVYSLSQQNRFYKKAAAFVLRAVAKHSPELAQNVVDSGALNALVDCLEEFDPGLMNILDCTIFRDGKFSRDKMGSAVNLPALPTMETQESQPTIPA
ncbi:Sperm-associated antigen 6 [Nowakowskiella sp. JEL0407]|nr:Sperm-associated antigen 6 [Nowakowskiella sp. JEL0407]